MEHEAVSRHDFIQAHRADVPSGFRLKANLKAEFEEKFRASEEGHASPYFRQVLYQPGELLRISPRQAVVDWIESHVPGRSELVLRHIDLAPKNPYQSGWLRRPYRAPRDPRLTDHALFERVLDTMVLLKSYPKPMEWLAAHADIVVGWDEFGSFSLLWAEGIDKGSKELKETLAAGLLGQGSTPGVVTSLALRTAMRTSQHDLHGIVLDLLVKAQREEGLRQEILEAADESGELAFIRLLRAVVEHGLMRFSSAARAAAVWIGIAPEDPLFKPHQMMVRLLQIIEGAEPNWADQTDAILASWWLAFRDADSAVEAIEERFDSLPQGLRLVLLQFTGRFATTQSTAFIARQVDSDDNELAGAAAYLLWGHSPWLVAAADAIGRLWRAADRLPKKGEGTSVSASPIGALVWHAPDSDLIRLLARRSDMNADARVHVMKRIAMAPSVPAPERRKWAIDFFSDVTAEVRQAAMEAFGSALESEEEATGVESLLTRKSSTLRQEAIALLSAQPDAAALASAKRMLGSKAQSQRLAGVSILQAMKEAGRSVEEAAAAAAAALASDRPLEQDERDQLGALAQEEHSHEKTSLNEGFGTIRKEDLTPIPVPKRTGFVLAHKEMLAGLKELVKWQELRGSEEITSRTSWGEATTWLLSEDLEISPPAGPVTPEELQSRAGHALLEEADAVWRKAARDDDGLAALRGFVLLNRLSTWGSSSLPKCLEKQLRKTGASLKKELRGGYVNILRTVLKWRMACGGGEALLDGWLDMVEEVLALMSGADRLDDAGQPAGEFMQRGWQLDDYLSDLLDVGALLLKWHPAAATRDRIHRRFLLESFRDRPSIPFVPEQEDEASAGKRKRMVYDMGDDEEEDAEFEELILGFGSGSFADFLQMDGAAKTAGGWSRAGISEDCLAAAAQEGLISQADIILSLTSSDLLSTAAAQFTARRRRSQPAICPEVVEAARKLIYAAVDLELERTELPGEFTSVVLMAGPALDAGRMLRLLSKNVDLKGWKSGRWDSRQRTFAQLLAHAAAPPEGSENWFVEAVRRAGIHRDRLLELAFLSPRWAGHVEAAIGIKGLSQAVWWIHAHSKASMGEGLSSTDKEWTDLVAERSSVHPEILSEGGVDVEWQARVMEEISQSDWKKVSSFAKFATEGNGHARAILHYDCLSGRKTVAELMEKVAASRSQDQLKGLGLVPLDQADPKADLVARFRFIQDFMHGSRKFGSARQASERKAVEIALENLARRGGYADPLRMTWQLEAEEAADLKGGGLVVQAGDMEIALRFDFVGRPVVEAVKDGRQWADLPAKVKKDPAAKALAERRKSLVRQEQRARWAMESAMVRGARFLGEELSSLCGHPGLAPLLQSLLWESDNFRGFLSPDGRTLAGLGGASRELQGGSEASVVHPVALAQDLSWPEWRTEVFAREVVQPFKQVFREIYVPTEVERTSAQSTRWAGHQVQPRQALGILAKRGWVTAYEEMPKRPFLWAGLVARLELLDAFGLPTEMEGMTLESVVFSRPGEYRPVPLAEVPTVVFSEVMRDIDLIVAVASMVGINPEASESTLEMRASVVQETARLARLDGVSLTPKHVVIKGSLGSYSVHLASGEVMMGPRHLAITAVRLPQFGRLFLPFIDDDPRTAEIVSKVVMLARDSEIKDPGIRKQITG